MPTTSPATAEEIRKLETAVQIRERIVRVTAEHLLDAIDRGEPIDGIVTRLRTAVDEAVAADDQLLDGFSRRAS